MLGTQLRLPYQYIVRRIHAGLERAGFDDLRPAHYTVFQLIPDGGARSTELADAAQMTKQSMGALIDHLEERGYVERVPDPADGRARIVRLTSRGWDVVIAARKCIAEVEAEWEQFLGGRRYDAFRTALGRINERAAADHR